MRTTDSVNNKKMNSMTEIEFQTLAESLRQNCRDLLSISRNRRDEKGNPVSSEDIAKSEDFRMAYRKAKANFNQLVKEGKRGDYIAHHIYFQEARKYAIFQLVEKAYKKHLGAKDDGILFDESKYFNYLTGNIKANVKAKKKASLKKVKSNRVIRVDHSKKAAIAVIALIAVIAFIVAACKNGLKPVIKACLCGFAMFSTILVFDKAKKDMLKRIKNKFYGSNE